VRLPHKGARHRELLILRSHDVGLKPGKVRLMGPSGLWEQIKGRTQERPVPHS
jgi:hypothetical protein